MKSSALLVVSGVLLGVVHAEASADLTRLFETNSCEHGENWQAE